MLHLIKINMKIGAINLLTSLKRGKSHLKNLKRCKLRIKKLNWWILKGLFRSKRHLYLPIKCCTRRKWFFWISLSQTRTCVNGCLLKRMLLQRESPQIISLCCHPLFLWDGTLGSASTTFKSARNLRCWFPETPRDKYRCNKARANPKEERMNL